MVGASLSGVPGCGDNYSPPDGAVLEEVGTYAFPQGVASGDPRADSVVVWTRVVLAGGPARNFGAIGLRVQLATEATFRRPVVDQPVTAADINDHTVRVLITGLDAATSYFYRFIAGQDSISGRTRTAAESNADVQVNLAWVSCQDFSAGHYGAYRQLLVDDAARPEADKIHAVIHLGDMIYETRADAFQSAIDDNFEPIMLKNRDGSDRVIPPFPSGPTATFATTVDDYRHLYKTFFSDPDLQAARARWPFISIWDDHEFTDDCWQSQANYTNVSSLDEPSQRRRVAASQAWFEFIPAHLSGAGGVKDVPSEARDFSPVEVEDKPFTMPNDDNFDPEPNNVAAVGAISIYRSLRFGKHVELVMTDERSYRSDHAIPEDISGGPPFLAARNALPLGLVNLFDAGKTFNNGNPPPVIPVEVAPGTVVNLPNLRKDSPPGTMLGKAQKAWWKATMKGSDATWKLWGNEVTMMRMRLLQLGPGGSDLCIAADAWDGYHTERTELTTFLKDEGIKNVVLLSGDIHASFAGIVMDNYDAAAPVPVATELVASGISSNSLFSFFEAATRGGDPQLRGLVTVDATPAGAKFTENFNLLMLHGTASAGTFAVTKNLTAALNVSNPDTNRHLKYADTNAQGYGYVKVNGTQVAASIITINRPVTTPTDAPPGIKRTVSFMIPKDDPGGMVGPMVAGPTKPFPL